jgi:hypothetical protein
MSETENQGQTTFFPGIVLRVVVVAAALAVCACARPSPVACTMEAKACPDGSYVGRNPDKNCEFNPCPAK